MLGADALLLATPFFVIFGWLSDKIGRKPIILTGCLLAAVTYFPLFGMLSNAANPALYAATLSSPVVVTADPNDCSVQFDPVGRNKFDSKSCDIAKSYLAKAGISYENVEAAPGTVASIAVGQRVIPAIDPTAVQSTDRAAAIATFQGDVTAALADAGYPANADPDAIDKPMVVFVLFVLVFYVTAVYGPIAAMLVELFPTNIRYTSMSLPYHIGNGWFGGFLPTTAFAIVAATGNIYSGLWYPVIVALITVVIGIFLLPETFRRKIDD